MVKIMLLAGWIMLWSAGDVADAQLDVEPSSNPAAVSTLTTGRLSGDPLEFFNLLVERYRNLHSYRDVSKVVEVTERTGESPYRVETSIACAIEAGELNVTTAARQVLRGLDVFLPIEPAPIAVDIQRKYNLWIAPHLTMKYARQPLLEFRAGVEQGFEATAVEPVTIDDRSLVHLTLTSSDALPEHEATFDLFIDPESMLIERIQGEQRLPDGASYQTTIDIRPMYSVSRADHAETATDDSAEHEPLAATPADLPSSPVPGSGSTVPTEKPSLPGGL